MDLIWMDDRSSTCVLEEKTLLNLLASSDMSSLNDFLLVDPALEDVFDPEMLDICMRAIDASCEHDNQSLASAESHALTPESFSLSQLFAEPSPLTCGADYTFLMYAYEDGDLYAQVPPLDRKSVV